MTLFQGQLNEKEHGICVYTKHLKHVSSQLGSEIIALLYKTGNAAIRNVFSKHQKVNSEVTDVIIILSMFSDLVMTPDYKGSLNSYLP